MHKYIATHVCSLNHILNAMMILSFNTSPWTTDSCWGACVRVCTAGRCAHSCMGLQSSGLRKDQRCYSHQWFWCSSQRGSSWCVWSRCYSQNHCSVKLRDHPSSFLSLFPPASVLPLFCRHSGMNLSILSDDAQLLVQHFLISSAGRYQSVQTDIVEPVLYYCT